MVANKSKNIKKWILGSSSKWRRELFVEHFQSNIFAVADIDEKGIRHPKAEIMTQMIARAKAEEIVRKEKTKGLLEDNLLVCCDQVIRFQGEIREKPETRDECRQFLRSYQQHPNEFIECINGICVYFNGRFLSHYGISKLTFQNLTDTKIEELIKLDDLMTCAGGFTVCHMDIKDQRGNINGIEGFPIKMVRELGNLCANLHISGKVTHCIFGIGVLLNMKDAYMRAHQELCKRYGSEFTSEINLPMIGLEDSKAAQMIIELFDFKITTQSYLNELYVIMEPILYQLELLPGAETLLNQLKSRHIEMAVVNQSSRVLMILNTTLIGKQLQEIFPGNIVCVDDIPVEDKTNPNVYQVAVQKLFTNNSVNLEVTKYQTVLVFEDSPIGVSKARGAGMNVIMIPNSSLPDGMESNCSLEIESLIDFNCDQFVD